MVIRERKAKLETEKIENKQRIKEVWEYFFEKPKKNYNKYIYEMVEYPEYLKLYCVGAQI